MESISITSMENSWLDNLESLVAFRISLISWGQCHFRAFPWRMTVDAYAILMAEIMLHRTQVKQMVPVYEQFIRKFPDINALSQASVDEVSATLSSLGLTWRIDLIKHMGGEIKSRFNNTIPQEKDALLSLPGISEYISGAIRCFAWGFPDALIDTNTVRITGRLFGIETKDSSRRNPVFRRLIQKLVDPDDPRTFNYAFLDLAHLICHKIKEPQCSACPINTFCQYWQVSVKKSRIEG
jgi:A/G-specific adenine glycosylase